MHTRGPLLASLVAVAACKHASSPAKGDAGLDAATTASAPVATATVAAGAVDGGSADAGEAIDACAHTLLQTSACIPAPPKATIKYAEASKWGTEHGAKDTKKLENEQCTETTFGPAHEAVLVCYDEEAVPFDPKLGQSGPQLPLASLRMWTVRDGHAVELVHVPLTVWVAGGKQLFRAGYVVDSAAGALDVTVAADDCVSIKPRLDAEWEKIRADGWPLTPAQIATEKKLEIPRIDAICRAVGHYTPDAKGKLAKR